MTARTRPRRRANLRLRKIAQRADFERRFISHLADLCAKDIVEYKSIAQFLLERLTNEQA